MKTTKLLFFSVLFLVASFSFGQNQEIEDLVQKGVEFHDKGEYKTAIEYYQKALSIDPNSALANYEIAFSYFSDKDYKNAAKYSKKVIDQKKDFRLSGYILYGNSLDMLGEPKKAIKIFERAVKDFDNYLLYFNYAVTCVNSGKLDKAYDLLLKAIRNNSSHASSHLLLSKVMEMKGSRIKAMLPLYYFLLLEPNSNRSAIQYQTLRDYFDYGVSKTSENNIKVEVPIQKDSDFGAAEMMISLLKASNSLEENQGKTDLELFAENNDSLFKVLGELKKDNSGFWWDFYITFFYEMSGGNFTKTFSYYISLSKGSEVSKWIEENEVELEKFKDWINK